MNAKDEPAFPTRRSVYEGGVDSTRAFFGMSKREYFASMAMSGLLSKHNINIDAESLAKASVLFADALLGELGK